MDAKRIHKYFAEDYVLSKGDLLDIDSILNEYPYFQSLRFTYLKGWYTIDYVKFKSELDRMAIFLSDREALFFYIFKKEFSHLVHQKKAILANDKTLDLINAFFEVTDAPVTNNLDIDVSTKNLATTDYLSFVDEIEEKRAKKSKSPDKVNISTSLITLETIDVPLGLENVDNETDPTTNEVEMLPAISNVDLISLETPEENKVIEVLESAVVDSQIDKEERPSVDTIKKAESLILIEKFQQLVKDHIGVVGGESSLDIPQEESVITIDAPMIEIITHAEQPISNFDDTTEDEIQAELSDVEQIGVVEVDNVVEQPSSLNEEKIEERDFNTIGSEEMSVLITQRLEESLSMIQEMRRNAQSAARKKDAIIDDFLSKELKPISLDKSELELDQDSYTLEDEESDDGLDEGFFTATLAKIYTKQGRYDKAYEIIKHLSLKVSNKNAYFVEQMNYLEKLISKKNKIK